MAQHLPCAATTRVSTDEFWVQKHVCPQERRSASAEETTAAREGRARGGRGSWEVPVDGSGEAAGPFPEGPSPKVIHQGEVFLATTEGTNGVSREVVGRGDGLSRTTASGALRGTPRGPCESAWEALGWAQPTASPLSLLGPKGTMGGKAGAEAGLQDKRRAQGTESPTPPPPGLV